MNTLAPVFPTNASTQSQWIYVTRRFNSLQASLALSQAEVDDGRTKLQGVLTSLNRAFWNESTVGNCLVVGSWGKQTAIKQPTDIDILFFPPQDIYHQFNLRQGNKQSYLLQYVRDALNVTYPQSVIRGDGQVVVVAFNSIRIEVVPAFAAQAGGCLTCDSNDGGSWKRVEPEEELRALNSADVAYNGNVRKLTRMIKQWKRHCNVPIKSFHIEQLVRETLEKSSYGANGEFWFDWLVRDVFLHMYGRAGGGFYMPGSTYEWIALDDSWKSKSWSAYERAIKACEFERANMDLSAGTEWQKIFGSAIPTEVN